MESWRCTVCDYVHEGDEPPENCPVCDALASEFEPIADEESGAATPPDGAAEDTHRLGQMGKGS